MGQFVTRKMQVEQWFSYIYARDMAKNCPRYIPDMPQTLASFAHAQFVAKNVANNAFFWVKLEYGNLACAHLTNSLQSQSKIGKGGTRRMATYRKI